MMDPSRFRITGPLKPHVEHVIGTGVYTPVGRKPGAPHGASQSLVGRSLACKRMS